MQFTSGIIALALASDSQQRRARRQLQPRRVYCYQSLLNKGNYHDHIVAVLQSVNSSTDEPHVVNSLYNFLDGGEITYQGYCAKGCGGVNSLDPDYCLP